MSLSSSEYSLTKPDKASYAFGDFQDNFMLRKDNYSGEYSPSYMLPPHIGVFPLHVDTYAIIHAKEF